MVCVPVRSIIPSLKLGDYLSVQAHKPCSISHVLIGSLHVLKHNPNMHVLSLFSAFHKHQNLVLQNHFPDLWAPSLHLLGCVLRMLVVLRHLVLGALFESLRH